MFRPLIDIIHFAHPSNSTILLSDAQYSAFREQLKAMGMSNNLSHIGEKKKEKNTRVSNGTTRND